MKCEKCNATLTGSMGSGKPHVPVSQTGDSDVLKGTIPEGRVFGSAADNPVKGNGVQSTCRKCGYPIVRRMNVCPNCGELVDGVAEQFLRDMPKASVLSGTINPWMSPPGGTFCTLRPLAWQGENIEYAPLSYPGEKIILNRANTDPNNQSITSKVQAEIVCENGEWFLEDRSEQQTTYVHVGRKTKLESGDIIILGNRRFEFKG